MTCFVMAALLLVGSSDDEHIPKDWSTVAIFEHLFVDLDVSGV